MARGLMARLAVSFFTGELLVGATEGEDSRGSLTPLLVTELGWVGVGVGTGSGAAFGSAT